MCRNPYWWLILANKVHDFGIVFSKVYTIHLHHNFFFTPRKHDHYTHTL